MAQRNVKARYRVVGPKTVAVRTRVSRMVKEKGSDEVSKIDKFEDVEKEMFMVYFPQGHSIRVDKKELIRMGYHLKPRLVDMDSGEVIDFGGDPYDFMGGEGKIVEEDDPDFKHHLVDDEEDDDDIAPAKTAKG